MPYIYKAHLGPISRNPASSLLAAYRAAQAMLAIQPETQETRRNMAINSSFLRPPSNQKS
jgi:hypothetical protein